MVHLFTPTPGTTMRKSRPPPPAAALLAIGLSAGGFAPLQRLLAALPAELPAAVVVAQHAGATPVLVDLLRRSTPLKVVMIEDGMPLLAGRIHVVPVERHVVVNPDATLSLREGDRIDFVRPSLDWLFHSAAASFGERLITIVLSGANADGARGTVCAHHVGGLTIAQYPSTAERAEMPVAAIMTGVVDEVLTVEAAAALVVEHLRYLDIDGLARSWEAPFAREEPTPRGRLPVA
jgi:two-component system chemotaxis response regulator CheB